MITLIQEPQATLKRVYGYVRQTLRRLYNQRNLVMHAGSLRSVALDATLRTAPALVGAGLDRIVHAALESKISPQQLALRAETEIELCGRNVGRRLAELLEAPQGSYPER